jgi:hypothetical protein
MSNSGGLANQLIESAKVVRGTFLFLPEAVISWIKLYLTEKGIKKARFCYNLKPTVTQMQVISIFNNASFSFSEMPDIMPHDTPRPVTKVQGNNR